MQFYSLPSLLDIHLNTDPYPCTQWFILQAYEKEDETPAAVPAEKKEKVAEKVNCSCLSSFNVLEPVYKCRATSGINIELT